MITVHLQIELSTHLKTIVANRRLYISDKKFKIDGIRKCHSGCEKPLEKDVLNQISAISYKERNAIVQGWRIPGIVNINFWRNKQGSLVNTVKSGNFC